MAQHWPVQTDRTAVDVPAQVLLKSSVRESRPRDLVFAEQQKKYRRGHPDHGDCLCQPGIICNHQSWFSLATRKLVLATDYPPGPSFETYCSSESSSCERSSILHSSRLRIESIPSNLPCSSTTGRCR